MKTFEIQGNMATGTNGMKRKNNNKDIILTYGFVFWDKTVERWNKLPSNVVNVNTFNTFKQG